MAIVRSDDPRSVRTRGRAVIARRTKRPNALIIVRKTIQRRARSAGVAAVSLIEGIANCGAGPGFGPTANVNAPRTGCPSTEITRQKPRYRPGGPVSVTLADGDVRRSAAWANAEAGRASAAAAATSATRSGRRPRLT